MVKAHCDDDEFIVLFRTYGPAYVAKALHITERGVFARRNRIEKRLKINVESPPSSNHRTKRVIRAGQRLHKIVENGTVLVGSDAHYWPGPASTAHRAFVHFCKKLKPKLVVLNGDVMDGARISRHARIGWDETPSLIDEIETCKDRLDEIRKSTPKSMFVWPLGNHDARFETKLANLAPEYLKVHGTRLQDHFPFWEPCWSVWVNENVVIKHRFKGGIHASRNNTLHSGMSMLTGHLHSLKVAPYSDYNGTRWGVDTGTMMDPYDDPTADYTEDNPTDWRSGFAVLTFKDGKLLWPEVVHVIDDGKVDFRGEVIEV